MDDQGSCYMVNECEMIGNNLDRGICMEKVYSLCDQQLMSKGPLVDRGTGMRECGIARNIQSLFLIISSAIVVCVTCVYALMRRKLSKWNILSCAMGLTLCFMLSGIIIRLGFPICYCSSHLCNI
jgi:hypothetical protein